jgi:hypothetical protein
VRVRVRRTCPVPTLQARVRRGLDRSTADHTHPRSAHRVYLYFYLSIYLSIYITPHATSRGRLPSWPARVALEGGRDTRPRGQLEQAARVSAGSNSGRGAAGPPPAPCCGRRCGPPLVPRLLSRPGNGAMAWHTNMASRRSLTAHAAILAAMSRPPPSAADRRILPPTSGALLARGLPAGPSRSSLRDALRPWRPALRLRPGATRRALSAPLLLHSFR